MSDLFADVRFALRGLLKRPATSLLLVATLALGLAANATIFNLLDALVIRAFDFPNQGRLVRVWENGRDFNGVDLDNVAPANLIDWREQSRADFADLVAIEGWDANLRGRDVTDRIQGQHVSPGFFDALGVRPIAGRGLLPEDAQAGRDRRVVIGYGLWQRVFGGEAGVLGKAVAINGEPHEIVGIAPPGFQFPEAAEVWAPLTLPAAAEAPRDKHNLSVLGRLRDGRSREQARAALAVVAGRLEREHPETNTARGIDIAPFARGFSDPVLPSLLVIWQSAAALVLLIACVNVANLILARGAERQRELGLRIALGAGRGRVMRQLLTEGVVAGLASVALAMPLQWLASRALRENMPVEITRYIPGWPQLGADWRSLLFSGALAVVAAALFSAIPAWRASRAEVQEALREGGRTSAGPGRQHGRNLLVIGQLAAALVLVATAGVALKSAHALLNGPQGFEPDGVLVMDVSLAEARYKDPEKSRAYIREALQRLAELPGVTQVAAVNTLPGKGYNSRGIEVEGQPLAKGEEPPEVDARWASDAIFLTLRVPILEGRGFESSDDEKGLPIAVVSRSMADRFWPGTSPIGKRFRVASKDASEQWLRVVGVSGDVIQQWLMRRRSPTFYQPLAQQPRLGLSFAVRGAGEPEALAMPARRALQRVDPDQPAYDVLSMRRLMVRSTIGLRYIAAIMAAFGVLALVLAVSGVYGVMSYRVSLRTTEIGVRVALGATRKDVLQLTLGQALRLSGVGLLLGSTLAFAAGRVLASTLRGAVAADPAVLAAVTLLLAAAAFVAAWVPARRALAVDPVTALRAE